VRKVLGHEDAAFAHGDDADFEAELARGREALGVADAGAGDDDGETGAAEAQLTAA
jgi:hypothetical protein